MPITACVSPESSARGPAPRSRARLTGDSTGRGAAVLRAVRSGRERGVGGTLERREEAVALAVEHRGDIGELERRREEVVARRVLLESAHEVADRDVELVRAHDGHVEEHVADLARDRGDLALRHAEQHLELEVVAHPGLAGEQPRVGDVEEVVPGDADAHRCGVLGPQREVEAADVVRVGVDLGVVGGERPVVHDGIHSLHREVRALHEAHLDARAAAGHPLLRPRRELLQRRERVGEVGLEHDARLEAAQARVFEDPREDRDREVEVAVLLHVEVDEGAVASAAVR